MKVKSCMVLVALMLLGLSPAVDACFMRSIQPVTVWLDHIHIDIKDQVAVKTYNCTFKNPNPQAVVGGTCYMELEPGAQVDDMSVLVDGKEFKAEILDVDKAKKVFTDIVKEGGSPALLEYYGNQLIQTQVPRIAPNSTVTVKLTYTTVLQKRGNVYRIQCLNTNPKASLQPLKSASVTINITSKDPLKNIYSPTHKINLEETEKADISVQWKQDNYLPKHPFVLYYSVAEEEVGATLLTHRELDEEGHFMLMLSPTVGTGAGKVTDEQILPKDVVFCVDTSGSMINGNKMDQARAALEYCVNHLRPQDRFNIVDFSTSVRAFEESGLIEVNDTNVRKALKYISKLAPRGGTAIEDALETSLTKLGESDRLKMVLFATDGLPTIGERNPESILKTMSKKNTEDVRMFVFGEGFDVNTKLLDYLALNHRGEADYILPEENISKKISAFFDRVGSPMMTDIKVEIDGLEVKDVYPRQIADIFKGEQVIVYGQYTGNGTKKVKLTGKFQGETRTMEYEMNFPEYTDDDKNAFIPRLWAGRKVDFLLNELRKAETQDKELVDEVTYLAKRYGIVTPYTSYLMAEDVAMNSPVTGNAGFLGNGKGQGGASRELLKKLKQSAQAAAPGATADSKAEAVKEAKDFADLRRSRDRSGGANALYEEAEKQLEAGRKSGEQRSSLSAIRYIGSKTFYRAADSWYDSQFDAEKEKDIQKIEVGSKEYFELLGKNSRLAQYLALNDVVLEIKGKWYRFESVKK